MPGSYNRCSRSLGRRLWGASGAGEVSLATGRLGRWTGSGNWQGLAMARALEQAADCPVHRAPLASGGGCLPGARGAAGFYFRSLARPQANDHSAWPGNSEEWGRALSAVLLLNEIASREVNGQPALQIRLPGSPAPLPSPCWAGPDSSCLFNSRLGHHAQSPDTSRKGLELISGAGSVYLRCLRDAPVPSRSPSRAPGTCFLPGGPARNGRTPLGLTKLSPAFL